MSDFDGFDSALYNATVLREMASRDDIPLGTDSASQFEILKDYILDFEKNLDHEHEVGMLLANFSKNVLLQVTHISYEYPSLMIFKGYSNGVTATLIQHVSQLSFLLTAVQKEPNRPKRKIGFSIQED